MSQFSCPSCGEEISAGMKFCVGCGLPTVKMPLIPRCAKCDAIAAVADQFCNLCGGAIVWPTQTTAAHTFCNHCGQKLANEDRFCPGCGTTIAPVVAPREPAAQVAIATPKPTPPPIRKTDIAAPPSITIAQRLEAIAAAPPKPVPPAQPAIVAATKPDPLPLRDESVAAGPTKRQPAPPPPASPPLPTAEPRNFAERPPVAVAAQLDKPIKPVATPVLERPIQASQPRRSPIGKLLAAAIALAVVAGLVVWSSSDGDTPPDPSAVATSSGEGGSQDATGSSPSRPQPPPPSLTDDARKEILASSAFAVEIDPVDSSRRLFEPTGNLHVVSSSATADGWQQFRIECEVVRRHLDRQSTEYPVMQVRVDPSGKVASIQTIGVRDAQWDMLLK